MHFKLLREPAWMENADLLGRGSKAAAWAPWHPRLAVDNIGSTAPIRASMPGAASGSHGQALHATLHLPDHTQLEVGEGTTLEELVSKLLAAQVRMAGPACEQGNLDTGGTRALGAPELLQALGGCTRDRQRDPILHAKAKATH